MPGNIDIPPSWADKYLFFPTNYRENIMSVVPVADVLQGRVAVDSEVTVRGWVRTRRDSKAGISFLAVYDGIPA
jgi:asparaginyl-tRNA synthetase